MVVLKPLRPLHEYVLHDVVVKRWTVPRGGMYLSKRPTMSEQMDAVIAYLKSSRMKREDLMGGEEDTYSKKE